MNSEFDVIVKKTLTLSTPDRACLAEILLKSLEIDFDEDFLISDEWMDEIHKRCNEIDSGNIELVEGEAALGGLWKKYSETI